MRNYRLFFLLCIVMYIILYLCYIVLYFYTVCFEQKHFPSENYIQNPLAKYIKNPAKSDTTCISEINEAKMLVEDGIIVFCYPVCFGCYPLRQEKHLETLCKQHGIILDYELFSDFISSGQTQGCFGAYMDKVIADSFGAGFKQKLLEQADSIMLAVNDTVPYYLCDKEPQRPDVDYVHESGNLTVKIPDELYNEVETNKDVRFSFMDIGFYIDKEGNTSGYFLNNSVDSTNQKLKDAFFDLGVEQLKEIKNWEPGIVNGQKVITENNVRVYFDWNFPRKLYKKL